jgi:hypothetical protein
MRNYFLILIALSFPSIHTFAGQAKQVSNTVCKGKPGEINFQKISKKQAAIEARISELISSLPTDQETKSDTKKSYDLTSAVMIGEKSPLAFQLKSDESVGLKGVLKSDSQLAKGDAANIKYDYEPNNDHTINVESSQFIDARSEFSILQRQVLDRKNGPNFFNSLNESEAAKKLTSNVNNFFLLQILALEKETLTQAKKYVEDHCESDSVIVDVVVENELKKILGTYRTLRAFHSNQDDGERAPASHERINASSSRR